MFQNDNGFQLHNFMAIPSNITKEHIKKAIQEINLEAIPTQRLVQYYSLVENGKILPPKYVVSFANRIANGFELKSNEFTAQHAKDFLTKLGFTVLDNRTNLGKETMNIWIEKTLVTGVEDRISGERQLGKALWSPQRSNPNKKTGSTSDVYKNMRYVKKGDIIIHLINDKNISGVSIAKGPFQEVSGLPGSEFDRPAYLIELDQYTQLDPVLERTEFLNIKYRDILEEISKSSQVFYTRKLDLRQGAYLTPCPIRLMTLLNIIYKEISGRNLPFMDEIDSSEITMKEIDGTTEKADIHINPKFLIHYIAIKTKPFIILAGLSGTGKSRLVRTLAYQFDNMISDRTDSKNPPTNFQLIKVKPNWHDSSELLGYESRISGKDRLIVTDFIRFIVKAMQYPDTPFFLCLDEMNLAPVEQYFAEYLSAIETRRIYAGKIKTDSLISGKLISKYANKSDGVDAKFDLWNELDLHNTFIQDDLKAIGLGLPSNLIVMGTVNMDETTHSFSRKVLDRAMTIEMNDINLSDGLNENSDDWTYPQDFLPKELVLSEKTQGAEVFADLGATGPEIIEYLGLINTKLEGSPFKIAYRVRDEFLMYAFNYSLLEKKPTDWLKNVLDEMTLMKILPRIEGDEDRTKVLDELIKLFQDNNLPKSVSKATEMASRRKLSHYTSFWS